MVIPNSVRSRLFVAPSIPSILVSVSILYYLLMNRALRAALNNNLIILLLACGFAWVFTGSTPLTPIPILMAWAWIEQHILIFYPNWFATKIKRFFFPYLPSEICILWPMLFYFVIFLILPCDISFYYSRRLCGRYTCVTDIYGIALWHSDSPQKRRK